VLTYTATYTLTALAFLIPGKAGIWNVGANGQIYLGGIAAALLVAYVPMPHIVWPLAAIVVGVGAGALWGLVPGVLEAYRHASSIVTTIMLNYVAKSFTSLLLLTVIGLKVTSVALTNEAKTPSGATLPAIPGLNTSIMIFIAIAIAAGSMLFLFRTTLGYKIRATGLGSTQAEAKGINPRSSKVIAMCIGGGIAGLVGAADILAPGHACGPNACLYIEWVEGWFGGEGFAGIAVALVAASNPIGAIFSALFFAILVAGGAAIPGTGPTVYLFWAVQAVIIIFMAAPYVGERILSFRRGKKRT
jgi:general nucleoside transport system permease protein